MRDLAEFSSLAFLAGFHPHPTLPSAPETPAPASTRKQVTYIGLSKKTMPTLVELYMRFKDDAEIYEDGTLEAILSVSASPPGFSFALMCTAPGLWNPDQAQVRVSGAVQVWQGCAAVEDGDDVFFACRDRVCGGIIETRRRCFSFRLVVRLTLSCLTAISDTHVEAIWRQIIEGFRGGILADWWVVND